MAEGVKFPDVPQLVCDHLRASPLLTGLHIGTKVPPTRPAEFILVLRTGGPRETIRSEAAQITVEAWAQDKARASSLLNDARAVLNAADAKVFGVREFGGPGDLPDPTTAQIRFTMSFQIRARGTAVTV
ncbi:hypothetical protein [Pseudarthrobacter sp. NIBRBAC000502770]|uniref:hypothetical protein n=1 Tax=Pseudarthrobacter sp. NIBRBAC000502770 TaxID=2590785 RepID=UPI00113FF24E|nr:hypothetical protein [Pseudarthrobacter sp. NIBRBAC000502770]QDG88866.1 hypothetical protein NIBR502770_10550 [Pseudarthrobacter sp. NIBRBAC000502770]